MAHARELRAQLFLKELLETCWELDYDTIWWELEFQTYARGSKLWVCLLVECVLREHVVHQANRDHGASEAKELLIHFAQKSHWASCLLGVCHYLGRMVKQDKPKGARLIAQAAKDGYERAYFFDKLCTVHREYASSYSNWIGWDNIRRFSLPLEYHKTMREHVMHLMWVKYKRLERLGDDACIDREFMLFWLKRHSVMWGFGRSVVREWLLSATRGDIKKIEKRAKYGDQGASMVLEVAFFSGALYYKCTGGCDSPKLGFETPAEFLLCALCDCGCLVAGGMGSAMKVLWEFRKEFDASETHEGIKHLTYELPAIYSAGGSSERFGDNMLVLAYIGKCLWSGWNCPRNRRKSREVFQLAAQLEEERGKDYQYISRCYRDIQNSFGDNTVQVEKSFLKLMCDVMFGNKTLSQ